MKDQVRKDKKDRRGVVLIMAMLFVAIFSSLTIAMLVMSSTNTQLADNHQQGNRALVNTHSGAEVVRYLLDGMTLPTSIEADMQDLLTAKGLTNITATVSGNEIALSSVSLDSASSDSFGAHITMLADSWQVDVTGTNGHLHRTVRTIYNITTQAQTVFDFGVATNGPLLMAGQAEISGANLAVESDVLIDTSIAGNSFEIGNQASIAGNVHIVNPLATFDVAPGSEIGGSFGEEAEDNVFLGAEPVEFPVPNTSYFEQFATGEVIDSNSNLGDYDVLDNVTISANTNPVFANDVLIRGVLLIEQPNNVIFAGQSVVQGIIVGDSLVGDDSPDNSIEFSGQVRCQDVSELIGTEFEDIKQETGTFLMAPGFSTDFSGQSSVISGVIAVAGVQFTGLAGGEINGSIINYSTEPMIMEGQGSLEFNRSGTSEVPAGFEPVYILEHTPSSYSEI